MSERYPGGYITKSPPTPTVSAAPGVWTLDQAMQYIKEGNWPVAGQGYLMSIGQSNFGSLDRNSNFLQTGSSNKETIFYGPWTGASTSGFYTTGTCFLIRNDGTLWGAGFNTYGQLGINQVVIDGSGASYFNSFTRVGTATDWSGAIISSAGDINDGFAIAVKSNGTLWAWGSNGSGRLGDGTTTNRSSPVQIGSGTTWQNVAGGTNFWIATKTDGTLWACGNNLNGQLGDGTTIRRSSPVQIGALTDWGNASLAAGDLYCSVVKADGTLWSWGSNATGRLGLNIAATQNRSSPVQVGSLTTWSKVFSGGERTFGITTAGALWAWGDASNGALGTGNQTNRSSPVQIGALTNWSSVAARNARYGTMAIKTDGTLWVWGQQVDPFAPGGAGVSSPVQIGSDTDWSQLINGYQVGYFDGKIFTITQAQLIFKTNKNRPWGSGSQTPYVEVSWPVLLTDDLWSSVSSNGYSSFGVKRNGTLWAWGFNEGGGGTQAGQLGLNDAINRSSPVQVGALTNWKNVYASWIATVGGSAYAITQSNQLYSWGYNASGELGQNNRTNRSSPVQVGALTDWLQIAPGDQFVVAVKTNNTLWSWGLGGNGQLGQNQINSRSSPVQIGALTDWRYASAAYQSAIATKTNNTLWAWGLNSNGQLGQNNLTTRSSPVQIGALTNWLKASMSENHCLAVKTDGTLWAWGRANQGQVGDSTTVDRSSPIQIGSNTNWKDVLAITNSSYAMTTTGQLYVWGRIAQSTNGAFNRLTSSPVQVGTQSYFVSFSDTPSTYVGLNNAFMLTNATT